MVGLCWAGGCAVYIKSRERVLMTNDLPPSIICLFFLFSFAVGHRSRVNGKMADDMGLVLRHVVAGSIVANGRAAQKDVTVFDRALLQRPSMRALGPVDFRMDMVPKHMRMAVS